METSTFDIESEREWPWRKTLFCFSTGKFSHEDILAGSGRTRFQNENFSSNNRSILFCASQPHLQNSWKQRKTKITENKYTSLFVTNANASSLKTDLFLFLHGCSNLHDIPNELIWSLKVSPRVFAIRRVSFYEPLAIVLLLNKSKVLDIRASRSWCVSFKWFKVNAHKQF